MKRREQQAEYDRVSEIHKGRLESSSVDATDANTVRLYSPVLCFYFLFHEGALTRLSARVFSQSQKVRKGRVPLDVPSHSLHQGRLSLRAV